MNQREQHFRVVSLKDGGQGHATLGSKMKAEIWPSHPVKLVWSKILISRLRNLQFTFLALVSPSLRDSR